MTIETATYISDLVAANPGATDAKAEGDDHIRLVKSTIKTTFPNVNGVVNPTPTEFNYLVGVTSLVQTQLAARLPLAGGTLTGALAVNAVSQAYTATSGSAALLTFMQLGRTGADSRWGVAGGINDFLTGTVQGDSVLYGIGVQSLWLGTNSLGRVVIDSLGYVSLSGAAPVQSNRWLEVGSSGKATSYIRNVCQTAGSVWFEALSAGFDTLVLGINNSGGTLNGLPTAAAGLVTAAATPIVFGTAATERLRITADGRLYGTALHNNAGAVTGTTNQYIASGTYTPTLTNVANTTARSANVCQWMRVGNVVTVSGTFTITPTASAANTIVNFTLPIASAFANIFEAGGQAIPIAFANSPVGYIAADSVAAQAVFTWQSSAGSAGISSQFPFSFTYLVR